MIPAPSLADEARRLRRLEQLGVLDTGPEPQFDALTQAAAVLTERPIALVSLVDGDRQWWKSAIGLPQGGGTPRAVSLCGHAIATEGLFEVEDARRDERFVDNPLVAGEPFMVHYAGMPLVMPEGERVGTLCVIDHKPGRLDARGRDALVHLAAVVVQQLLLRERDRQVLAAAQADLERAGRRKDEFLAMVAHELRNPLAPIDSAARLLLFDAVDPARVREKAELIARQVRHLGALVDDLLDHTRVAHGMVELRMEQVALQEAIEAALEQAEPLLVQRQHQLAITVPPSPVLVHGDRSRLTQVLANLLNNAAKYTPPGGNIRIDLAAGVGEARVDVADNGLGIPPELLPHVFEPFMQERRTADRGQGGVGLGLPLVHRLVQLHGGRVVVHSEGRGRGCTVTVTLPLAAASRTGPDAAQAASAGRAISSIL